jgi:hypothetical protein
MIDSCFKALFIQRTISCFKRLLWLVAMFSSTHANRDTVLKLDIALCLVPLSIDFIYMVECRTSTYNMSFELDQTVMELGFDI